MTALKTQVFTNEPCFTASIDKAFRSIINDSYQGIQLKSAELLARYCDLQLKKNQKAMLIESDIDEKLSNLVLV
jgi:hypothetical protein